MTDFRNHNLIVTISSRDLLREHESIVLALQDLDKARGIMKLASVSDYSAVYKNIEARQIATPAHNLIVDTMRLMEAQATAIRRELLTRLGADEFGDIPF